MAISRPLLHLVLAIAGFSFATGEAFSRTLTGVWFDPARSGTGVTMLQEGTTVSGVWYFYGESGEGVWYTFVGTLDGNSLSADLQRFTGPVLGSEFDSSAVMQVKAGEVAITQRSAGTVDFEYTLERAGANDVSAVFDLIPFALTVTNTDRLAEFAGFYAGTFSGDDAGAVGVNADGLGTVSGAAVSIDGSEFSVTGTVTVDGDLSFTAGSVSTGARFTGAVAADGTATGTWVNEAASASGTFRASRQD